MGVERKYKKKRKKLMREGAICNDFERFNVLKGGLQV